jgi:tape measure domain-containing protein
MLSLNNSTKMAIRQDKVQIRIDFITDESKALAKASSEIKGLNKLIDDSTGEIKKLEREYENLSKSVNRTAEQEARLVTIQKELADKNALVAESMKKITAAGGDISKLDLTKVSAVQLREIKKMIVAQREFVQIGSEEYKKLTASIESVTARLTEVDRATRGVSGATHNMRDDAGAQFGKLGEFISGVGAKFGPIAAGIGAVIGVVRGLGSAIGKAADLEQTTIAFETFLGSGEKAKKLIAELREFSNVTPLEPEQVISAGRQLAAFGFETEKIIPILGKLGNVSAGTGKDFNELVSIYGKAKASGKIQGDDLNQLAEAGIPIYAELGKVLGVTEDKIRKLGEEGKINFGDLEKVFSNLTNEGGRFSGLMEKQSKSLTGLLSTLKGSFNELMTNIGQAFLPISKAVLAVLIPAFDALRTSLSPLLQALGERLTAAFDFLMRATQPIWEAFKNLRAAFSGLSADTSVLDATFKAIGAAFTIAANWAGHFINTLATVVKVIRDVYDASPLLQKIFGGIKEFALAPIQAITYLIAGLNGLVEFSKAAYEQVAAGIEVTTLATQFAIAKIRGLIDSEQSKLADEYYNKMQSASAKIGQGIGGAFTKGWNNALGNFAKNTEAATKEAGKKVETETRKIEDDGKKAAKEKEKRQKEELKNELDRIEGFYSRQEALQENLFIRKLISDSDYEKNLLTFKKAKYEEQLAEYKKFGKDQELEAIKIGNNLIEVQAKLASKQGVAPLAALKTKGPGNVSADKSNKDRKDLLSMNESDYVASMRILATQLESGLMIEDGYELKKLELKRDYLDDEISLMKTGTDTQVEEIKKRENEKLSIEEQISKKKIENAKREEEVKRQFQSQALTGLSDFFNAAADLLGKDEESRKKNAEQIKTLKIAGTTLSGINEVASIWEHAAANPINAIIPGAGYVLGAIQTATAIARTGLAISQINSVKYAKGGFTGQGYHYDDTGHRVAGVVHDNEYVIPKWQVQHAAYRPILNQLETARLRGFAQGGFTTPTFSQIPQVNQSFTNNTQVDLSQVVAELKSLRGEVAAYNGRLKVVYSDIEAVGTTYSTTKSRANF